MDIINPPLTQLKHNKRVGQLTPVIRVYKTKAGLPMFFRIDHENILRTLYNPYIYWSYPLASGTINWPALKRFYIRITGLEIK